MEEDRIAAAMARIEAAARRIESATARPAPPPPRTTFLGDTDLAERHERLRQEAWAALAEIDTLIETLDA